MGIVCAVLGEALDVRVLGIEVCAVGWVSLAPTLSH